METRCSSGRRPRAGRRFTFALTPTPRGCAKRRGSTRLKAIDKGLIAINSILRDWVKGQMTAVECGIMSFTAVFMPYMLASDGRPMLEHLATTGLLPAPAEDHVN